jgi:hypothetical protein
MNDTLPRILVTPKPTKWWQFRKRRHDRKMADYLESYMNTPEYKEALKDSVKQLEYWLSLGRKV